MNMQIIFEHQIHTKLLLNILLAEKIQCIVKNSRSLRLELGMFIHQRKRCGKEKDYLKRVTLVRKDCRKYV